MSYRIYLAGPIFGKTDAEARSWRLLASKLLERKGHEGVDPFAWGDYRDADTLDPRISDRVVAQDLLRLRKCDGMLVNAVVPSWGTAMEIAYARMFGIPVVAFGHFGRLGPDDIFYPSPWLHHHAAYLTGEVEEAVDLLLMVLPNPGL